jgi:hypothetical protein
MPTAGVPEALLTAWLSAGNLGKITDPALLHGPARNCPFLRAAVLALERSELLERMPLTKF